MDGQRVTQLDILEYVSIIMWSVGLLCLCQLLWMRLSYITSLFLFVLIFLCFPARLRVRSMSEETQPRTMTQHRRQVARILRQVGITGGQEATSCSGLEDHWKDLE